MTQGDMTKAERRIVGGRIGDPTREMVGQPIPVILPDQAPLFARRADRLESLARQHPMADWLRFMARVARAQHDAVLALPPADAVDVIEGAPPLATDRHRLEPDWQAGLRLILDTLDDPALADRAREVLRTVRAHESSQLGALADAYYGGPCSRGRLARASTSRPRSRYISFATQRCCP